MTTRIIGTGSALPEAVVTNDDLSKLVDTSDEWISSRTGIRERRLVNPDENTVSLGAKAAQKALEDAKVSPGEIDLILVATSSSEFYFPSVACQIQGILRLDNAVAMDVSAACSGFLFVLNTAHAYLKSGIYRRALLVGTDTLSHLINWEDRSTCVLFGDGAGACVVEQQETGVIDFLQQTDGSMGHVLTCSAATFASPISESAPFQSIYMDGQAVLKFAVKKVPACIRQLLERNCTEVDDIQWYLLHQANRRIIQSVAKRLGQPEEKFPINLDQYGNTSAASIPILVDELHKSGRLKRGDKCVLSGFGAGLTWGAALIEW